MKKKQLKQTILDRIKGNTPIIGVISEAIAEANNEDPLSPRTIERYIADNESVLASDGPLKAISEKLGIPVKELYEEFEVTD